MFQPLQARLQKWIYFDHYNSLVRGNKILLSVGFFILVACPLENVIRK